MTLTQLRLTLIAPVLCRCRGNHVSRCSPSTDVGRHRIYTGRSLTTNYNTNIVIIYLNIHRSLSLASSYWPLAFSLNEFTAARHSQTSDGCIVVVN